MDAYDYFLSEPDIQNAFPNLNKSNSSITSPPDEYYNCIAWAAEFDDVWMWPDQNTPEYYWPPELKKENTVDAFKKAFALYGYTECENGTFQEGIVKVVLYVDNTNVPTHMSRQLISDNKWTSKLGSTYDISHDDPSDLDGPAYGTAKYYFQKQIL